MSKAPQWMRRLIYDEAQAEVRIIDASERPEIMRTHIVSGAMGMMYFQLVTGMYLVAFGGNIGLEYWHWGLLSALTALAAGLTPVSAYMVGRVWNRKSLWFVSAIVARPMRVVAIGVAYGLFGVAPEWSRGVFIALLATAAALDAISVPPWYCWLVDIIPNDEHGKFWGRRSAWIALANVLVLIPIAYVMDRVHGGEGFNALLVLFGIGMAFGFGDLWLHKTIPEPPMKAPRETSFWEEVARPLRDKEYRPWLWFTTVWSFGLWLGAALAWVYFVDELGIRKAFLGGAISLIVIPMVASAVAGRWLGQLLDRHGVRKTLWWGTWVWAVLPLFWIMADLNHSLMWVWLGSGSLIAGFGIEAAQNAGTKLATRFRPTNEAPMYWAIPTCMGAATGAAGSLAAGLALQALKGHSWPIAGIAITGFHAIFLASFALRGASTLLIKRIGAAQQEEKGSCE